MDELTNPPATSAGTPTPETGSGLTRRHLLQGATAAAPFVAACAAAAKVPAEQAPLPPLKIGLVGCGGRGLGAAWNAINAEDGTVVLVAMADVFPERIENGLGALGEWAGEEQADRINVADDRRYTGFDAYKRLIESDVDVVLLCTPPAFRPAHLACAVENDKHVFVEKPMAVDGVGVKSVVASAALAQERRLSVVSGFCWRKNIRHRALYHRILEGEIGDVRAVYGTYNASPIGSHPREEGWSDMEWMLRNWHHFYELSGDHVTEQACHTIDKIAWAFGDVPPLSVVATGGNATKTGPEAGNTFDHFTATFLYPEGAKGFLMCRQMANTATENNDYILGTSGTATVEGWTPLHRIDGKQPWIYEGEGNDMYQTEHDEFFASIRSGEPINEGSVMAQSTLMSIMVRLSAYSGQVVTWQQALDSKEVLTLGEYSLGPVAAQALPVPGVTPLV